MNEISALSFIKCIAIIRMVVISYNLKYSMFLM